MDTKYECVKLWLVDMQISLSRGGMTKYDAENRCRKMNAMFKRNDFDAFMFVRPEGSNEIPKITTCK